MPDWTTLLAFALASTILIVVPGPTVALVVTRTLGAGRRATVPLTLGVAGGDLVATTLSLAGVGALLAASAQLFTAVKWIGAAYLVYLAVRMWSAPVGLAVEHGPEPRGRAVGSAAILREAFVVTVLNPKGIVFFVAFVPQFLATDRAYWPQALVFAGLFTLIGALNVVAYSLTADGLRRAAGRPGVLRAMSRAGAAAMGAAGIATLFARRA